MKITVWITHISHKHGDDLYASPSAEAADKIVKNYVDSWWGDEMDPEHVKPEDPDEMIEHYFEAKDDESYQIQTAELDIDISKV